MSDDYPVDPSRSLHPKKKPPKPRTGGGGIAKKARGQPRPDYRPRSDKRYR